MINQVLLNMRLLLFYEIYKSINNKLFFFLKDLQNLSEICLKDLLLLHHKITIFII